jgi:cell division protein FtsB
VSSTSRLPRILAIAVIAALAVLSLAANRAWQALEVARAKKLELATKIATQQQQVEILRQRVVRLRRDPRALEAVAREQLGWVRPDDLVVIFEKEPKAPPVVYAAPEPRVEPPSG